MVAVLKLLQDTYDFKILITTGEEENESWSDVNSWNWTTDWEEKGQIENENISEWMSLVIIAISPQFENLILAYQDRCVVMSCKHITYFIYL